MADRQKPRTSLDVAGIFAALGGTPLSVHQKLIEHNTTAPVADTIYMWRKRDVIAASWIASVMHALVCEGYDPCAFLEPPFPSRAPRRD